MPRACRTGPRRNDARIRRDDRRKRGRGVRPLPGGLRGAGAFRGASDGQVLGRDGRVRRRDDVDFALGERSGFGAVHLRKHRAVAALPAGASRGGVRSGDAGAFPHRVRLGVRSHRGAGRCGAGCRGARRPLGRAGGAARADGRRRSVRRGDGKRVTEE